MDDLMRCLYSFMLETRMRDTVSDPEYRSSLDEVLRLEDKVQENMDEEQRRTLNQLMQKVSAQNAIENEHIFQASLVLARELRALAGV